MRVVIDVEALQRIRDMTPQRAGALVRKIALDAQAEVVNNFNVQSPAPAGEPPGVDTSALKNSIVAVKGSRPFEYILQDGVEYGVHLEYGTASMAARPFMLPAVERVINNLPSDLAEAVYIDGDVS